VFDGAAWTIGQDWSASNTWTWIPPVSGSYAVQVWARNAGSAAAFDAWRGVTSYPVGAPTALAATSLTADRTGPVPAGTPVTWTAAGIGGAGPYSYRFYVFNGTSWSIGRDWASSNAWTWIPPAPGTYQFQVWLRNNGSGATYDAWRAAGPVTVTAATPLSISSILTSPSAPFVVNGAATVIANASGGTGPYTYKFYVFNGTSWSVGRDWGASNTWTWTPTAPGTYSIQVWVRNAGSVADYDAWRPLGPFVVSP
jgi:stage II sporulation protein D